MNTEVNLGGSMKGVKYVDYLSDSFRLGSTETNDCD
jgi:hypothetical protein